MTWLRLLAHTRTTKNISTLVNFERQKAKTLFQKCECSCSRSSTRLLSTSSMNCAKDDMGDVVLQEEKDTALKSYEYFETVEEKNKRNFRNAIDLFNKRGSHKRGAVEFILAALKNMEAYGVHKDLETYRALADIFPKGKYVPENRFQVEFAHYPKQQDCMVRILTYMETNDVIPDRNFGRLIENIFGEKNRPIRKLMRLMYWMPKFKNLSPWPLPFEIPKESLEIAQLAIKQITSVDRNTKIQVLQTADVEESVDDTWIVSGQSRKQQDIISFLPKGKALYVEGAFRVWLRKTQVNYFILRGEGVAPPPIPKSDADDVNKIKRWIIGEGPDKEDAEAALARIPTVHEQEDGTILACCATGTSSKDSLLSWIRLLQRDNPELEGIPILFALTSPLGPVVPVGDSTAVKPVK